jgi:ornithine cyclodeaminase/alanine dehydrogenase-like protein (mu-crystallin family)
MEQLMNKEKIKAIVATYLRAAVASVLALYLAGTSDLKTLALAGVAAVAGPVLKALDPNSSEFGVGSK